MSGILYVQKTIHLCWSLLGVKMAFGMGGLAVLKLLMLSWVWRMVLKDGTMHWLKILNMPVHTSIKMASLKVKDVGLMQQMGKSVPNMLS